MPAVGVTMPAEQAYYKARKLGKRIPELEGIISKDAKYSFHYAQDVIRGRWELGEAAISQDADYSFRYAFDVIKGRWELAEPAISKKAFYSYWYARYVIKGRLPDFMHNAVLLSNSEYTKQYVEFIK